jgi:hypothetical protein
MTSGIDSPQLVIVYNTAEKFEETGVVGWIELFGSPQYSVVVRPGMVMLDGAAMLNPGRARILSQAIDAAAVMAEDYHGHIATQSDGDEDLT